MILFPAIDLKKGVCVRLYKGDMDKATVFNQDPAAQARDFTACGCHWLHVVDLDGAFAGRPVNAEAVSAVSVRTIPRWSPLKSALHMWCCAVSGRGEVR